MAQSVLQYLKENLTIPGETATDFMQMWKELSTEDKSDLKAWATAEMG